MLLRNWLLSLVLTLSFSVPATMAAAADSSSDSSPKATTAKAKAKVRAKARVKARLVRRAAYVAQTPPAAGALDDSLGGELRLASAKALILNQETGEVLYAKSTDTPTPIASVTKLMTAMVVLDAHLPMDELLTVSNADVDTLKRTSSRLPVGSTLSRAEMLQLALMASENRAASVLGHSYPGGIDAFVKAMNIKATMLGMTRTHFVDSTGLNSDNVSTAEDLAKMVNAAYAYPEIRQVTTSASYEVAMNGMRRPAEFHNTNILVRDSKSDWNIGLSKTGFINEAGRCLVMQAMIGGQPMIIVLLDSVGKFTRIGDANRVRKWLESHQQQMMAKMG